jgi:hypothetical protein
MTPIVSVTIVITLIVTSLFLYSIYRQTMSTQQALQDEVNKTQAQQEALIKNALAAAAAQSALGDADFDNNWDGNQNLWRAGYGYRGAGGLRGDGGGRGGGGGHGGRR